MRTKPMIAHARCTHQSSFADTTRSALASLRSIAFESVRRDVVGDQNGGHDEEERDLDDQARVRATAGNQVPDDDAGEADKIQLHEWRRKERVKRHLSHHALPPDEEDRLRCQIWEERPRRRAPARAIFPEQCLFGHRINELFLARIDDEDGEQARGFRVARVRAHEMTVAGILGPAFAGAIGGHRAIVDLASDRPLQHRCIDEGGASGGYAQAKSRRARIRPARP